MVFPACRGALILLHEQILIITYIITDVQCTMCTKCTMFTFGNIYGCSNNVISKSIYTYNSWVYNLYFNPILITRLFSFCQKKKKITFYIHYICQLRLSDIQRPPPQRRRRWCPCKFRNPIVQQLYYMIIVNKIVRFRTI